VDFATLAELPVGKSVVTLSIATGSDFSMFLNTPRFLIVIGGALAATMIKFPMSAFSYPCRSAQGRLHQR